MPRKKLTKSNIDSIKFSDQGQVIYWDTDTPGLGLVVGARTKTFRLQMDVRDTTKPKGYRTVKKTLGRYGDITLEQAKDMVRGHVDKGTGEAVLGERLKIRLGDAPNAGDGVTLKELVASYYKETRRCDGKERRESSVIRYQASIERHYVGWLSLSLKEINNLTPDAVLDKFQQLTAAGPMAARTSSLALSSVINYGLAKYPGSLKFNPMAILTSRYVQVMEKIKPRHECLIYDADKKRNDFQTFFDKIKTLPEVRQDMLLFTLYTGMRNAEASTLKWENLDLEHKELHILDTKNRNDLHIPLSRQAMAILYRRKELAVEDVTWIFPTRSAVKTKQVTGHSCIRSDELKKVTGLDMTIHGLRRTFITVGRKLKRYEDTDRLTNHVDSSMAGEHYDETDIEDLRETANMIGNEIERRMMAETAKVIDITTGRAAA